MLLGIAFIFGIAIGSFLNVLIDRMPRGESIFLKRSHCESCKKQIAWYDLFPVFSYLILKGKCRYCKNKITPRLIAVELLTGLLFVFSVLGNPGFSYVITAYLLFTGLCLIVIFFDDLEYGIIPDQILLALSASTLIYALFIDPSSLQVRVYSALGSLFFYFSLFVITKGRGMGFGDVKYAGVLGLVLSYPNIVVSHYLAFLTGAVISIILILLRRKKLRGSTVPFGPFMTISAVIAYFWGERLYDVFLGLIF